MLQRSVCWARQTGKNELVEVAYVAPSAHVRRDCLFTETFEIFKAADGRSDSDRALPREFVDSALFQDRETVLSTGRSVPRFQLGDVFLAVGDRVDVDLQDGTGVRGAAVVDAYFAEAADGLNVDACQHAGDFVVKCKLSGGEEANILAHYWHSSSLPPLSWMTDDAAAVSVTALRRILAECASSTGEATGDLGMATASGGHERLEGDGTAKPGQQRRMTWGEKDGAAFLIVCLCFYSDDFRAHVAKEISMGGVYMSYLSGLFNDRRSSHAVRTLAATLPGVDSDVILEAIAPDLRVGAKDGWLCEGADGKPVRVYADVCF